jgi:type II secretory pathway pseudopilin PulG
MSLELQGRIVEDARHNTPSCRRAFTIVEAVISTVIVAVMFVAALSTVGAARITQHRAALVSRGRLLVESLLSEVLQQSYKDSDGAAVFGVESGEATTTRADFDDVDDFDGWSSSPPVGRDGTPLTSSTGWKRTVQVQWVDASDPGQVKAVETGVKRVTVTAAYGGVPQASLVALRTVDP